MVLEVWGEAGAGGGDVRGEDRATAVGHGAVLGSEGWAVRGGRVWVGTQQGSGRGAGWGCAEGCCDGRERCGDITEPGRDSQR